MSTFDSRRGDQGRNGPVQNRLDRRGFFRGAAALGSLGAVGLLPSLPSQSVFAAEAQNSAASDALAAQTQRVMRWTGPFPADWVRPRQGADHNVVIVGGGQTGLTLAYGLRRKGVGGVQVIDQAEPGQA